MNEFISVIVPNRNGSATIGKCLEAVYGSAYAPYEVIVVDDGSQDNSVPIIKSYPCKLIQISEPHGASRARNVGATHSRGSILFFTDADCLLQANTLKEVMEAMKERPQGRIVGGTYTRLSHDRTFFSDFQSLFIHDAETKAPENPDYVATHAMAIAARTFKESGGFREDFLPILEDVEFSHRMGRAGARLSMNPAVLVQHVFNFTLVSSWVNGMRKSFYWTIYSLGNKDLLTDSGTASLGLKASLVSLVVMFILLARIGSGESLYLYGAVIPLGVNLLMNRKLFRTFYEAKGMAFMIAAVLYYITLYTVAAGAGALAGTVKFFRGDTGRTGRTTESNKTVPSEPTRSP